VNSSISEIEQKVDQLHEQTESFLKGAITNKLLSENQGQFVKTGEQNPDLLFGGDKHRPLVVAFFGGTGVGKSTLLNRFAGEAIARTGIERPTSREVTIFVHHSVEIKHLPKDFPVGKVNIRQHKDDEKRQILWIDMPDIDSVELSNLEIVHDWLPFIDVLIYVVSPERYRDDRGWQLLLNEGYQHAWLFVINQWDQGDESIHADFEALLEKAGFEEPLIFRTDCLSGENRDDFDRLKQILISIANDHTVNELARRGIWNHLSALQEALRQAIEALGSRERFDQLETATRSFWTQTANDVQQHLELPLVKTAMKFKPLPFSFLDWLRSGKNPGPTDPTPSDTIDVWDERSQTLVENLLDKIILEADRLGLPAKQIDDSLNDLRSRIREIMIRRIQEGLHQSLAKPGGRLQRFIHGFLGWMATLLPFSALGWIAYRILTVFYHESVNGYLGIDFAIHSTLLVLVAWLIPWLLYRKTQPSIQQAARHGLETGLNKGLADVEAEIGTVLSRSRQLHDAFLTMAEELLSACVSLKPQSAEISNATLSRMLQKKLHSEEGTPKL